jgi:PAS domain S-box-containing protein
MSERYHRATDILELKDLLLTTLVGLTMDDIAGHFEVSRRTAERMVGALRDRFLEVQAETREGRKYWRLCSSGRTQPEGLPRNLEELGRKVDSRQDAAHESSSLAGKFLEGADDLLMNSAVGIFLLDVDFKVVWISRAMESYLGIDRAHVIGHDKRKLVRGLIRNHLADPLHFEERVLAAYENNTYIKNFRCHVLPAEGREERWLEHWSQPITTGPYSGGRVEHYIDITESVRSEQARHRELRALRGRFQDADRSVKAEGVTSAVAHSMIAPLTDILAIANVPQNKETDTMRAAALAEISGLATQIGKSLDRMLDLTKSERPAFECMKAKPILASAANAVHPSATQSGVEIKLTVLPELEFQVDPQLLKCALTELLKNAIEAMPQGGRISLAAERIEATAEILICVSDRGIGIRDDLRKRVLAPFYTTRKHATGLGLGIASSVANLHGGRIEIAEAQEGGTRVNLTLPIERI